MRVRSRTENINRNFLGFLGFLRTNGILAAELLDLFLLSDLFWLFDYCVMLLHGDARQSPTELAITPCSPKAEKPEKPGEASLFQGALKSPKRSKRPSPLETAEKPGKAEKVEKVEKVEKGRKASAVVKREKSPKSPKSLKRPDRPPSGDRDQAALTRPRSRPESGEMCATVCRSRAERAAECFWSALACGATTTGRSLPPRHGSRGLWHLAALLAQSTQAVEPSRRHAAGEIAQRG